MRPVMTIGLLTTRAAIDPVGPRGRLRDRPRLTVMRAVAAQVLRRQLDALLAQAVTLQTRLVGGGEHVARDVVPSAVNRGRCERDDRYPMIGAESLACAKRVSRPAAMCK